MSEMHQGMENQELVDPSVLTEAKICTKCGKLAVDGRCENTVQGNMTVLEYFIPETVPRWLKFFYSKDSYIRTIKAALSMMKKFEDMFSLNLSLKYKEHILNQNFHHQLQ